jgi:hypothetical protein
MCWKKRVAALTVIVDALRKEVAELRRKGSEDD